MCNIYQFVQLPFIYTVLNATIKQLQKPENENYNFNFRFCFVLYLKNKSSFTLLKKKNNEDNTSFIFDKCTRNQMQVISNAILIIYGCPNRVLSSRSIPVPKLDRIFFFCWRSHRKRHIFQPINFAYITHFTYIFVCFVCRPLSRFTSL